MHFSGLMVSKSNFQCAGPGSFPGRAGYEFTCRFFFEGCNEGIKGKETEGRGSTLKWGETPLEGSGGGGGEGGQNVKIL